MNKIFLSFCILFSSTAALGSSHLKLNIPVATRMMQCSQSFVSRFFPRLNEKFKPVTTSGTWTLDNGTVLEGEGQAVWLPRKRIWHPVGSWNFHSTDPQSPFERQVYYAPEVKDKLGPYRNTKSRLIITNDPLGELSQYTLEKSLVFKRDLFFSGLTTGTNVNSSDVMWIRYEKSLDPLDREVRLTVYEWDGRTTTLSSDSSSPTKVSQHRLNLSYSPIGQPFQYSQMILFPDSGPEDILAALSTFALHSQTGVNEELGADAFISSQFLERFNHPDLKSGKLLAKALERALTLDIDEYGILRTAHGYIRHSFSYSLDRLAEPKVIHADEITKFLYGSLENRLLLTKDKNNVKALDPTLFILTDVDLKNPQHRGFISTLKSSAYGRPFSFLLIEKEGIDAGNQENQLQFKNYFLNDPKISPFENILQPFGSNNRPAVVVEGGQSDWTFDEALFLMFPEGVPAEDSYSTAL